MNSVVNKFVLLLFLCCLGLICPAQKDISWDIKTGDEAAKMVEKTIGLVKLSLAEKTVNDIGTRLVSQLTNNPYHFTFQIIDQPEPNAFAVPGGHVYISRGLMALINTEDELAGVLGHEISHVILRHAAKQKKKSFLPTLIAAPGVLLGSVIGGDLGEKVASPLLGAGRMLVASYSRKQETEADEMGIGLAANAGYNPVALGDILNRIELSLQSDNGKASKFSLFNDHPMTPDRMDAINTLSKTLSRSSISALYTQPELLASFDHLMFGANPAQGVFNNNIFLHPTLKFYWELPANWTYQNESKAAGAMKDEEMILVTIAGKDTQLDTLIENFVNGYYAKTRKQPLSDLRIKMTDGQTASELIEPTSQSNRIIYSFWFRKDKMTFVILATGSKTSIDTFRKCSTTFRDLNTTDSQLITLQELMTLKAQTEETLSDFSQHNGNSVSTKYSAVMNGIPENGTLKAGVPVKIVLRIPYTQP